MIVLGIDEVGRGGWAGPLVVGAVILDHPIIGLTDSKLLSKIKRELLNKIILSQATATGLGWVEPSEIDRLGLTAATKLAIERALAQIEVHYDEILIDGSINFIKDNPKSRCEIKADLIYPSVSAASIIAKVARDNYMAKLSETYPDYGFDKHVGYGTALHKSKLLEFGVTKIHRHSYAPIKLIEASF
jgi:ribonuclease HII